MNTNELERGGVRVGLLYPTRDCGEDDFVELAARLDPSIAVDFAYVPWPATVDRLEDLDAAGKRAALQGLGDIDRLTTATTQFTQPPDVVSWACSSCSFLRGLPGARAQTRALTARLGVPASSTSLAFLAAARRLRLSRIGLGSVYSPDITAAFIDFLAAAGITTTRHVSFDAPSDRALATWGHRQILDLVEAADNDLAEAVLVPETALHTAELLSELERRIGKPVLTATQVTLWHVLDQLGRNRTHHEHGTLFAT